MKEDAKILLRYLHKKLGREELHTFLSLFHGLRITLPEWKHFEDAARDAEVMEAWRIKAPGTITEFCRQQAREQQCSPKTIERVLSRSFRKSA